MLLPSLVEIGQVVLEKVIFKVCQCIFAISSLSPFEKGQGPSFEQSWIRFTQGCFVPTLVAIVTLVLEKKLKMWKVYDNVNGPILIRKAHLSLRLRWAKKFKCRAYSSAHLMQHFLFVKENYWQQIVCINIIKFFT